MNNEEFTREYSDFEKWVISHNPYRGDEPYLGNPYDIDCAYDFSNMEILTAQLSADIKQNGSMNLATIKRVFDDLARF